MPQLGLPEGPRGLSPSSGRKDRRRRKHRGAGGRRRKAQVAMREGAADAAKQERSLWARGSQMQVGRIRRLCRAGRQTPLSRSPPNKLRQVWRNRGAGVPRNDCRRCGKTQTGRPETEGDAAMRRTESRFGGSAARRLGGSAARRLGGSAARRLGGSAARRLGGSAARRLGGSAARRLIIVASASSAIVKPPDEHDEHTSSCLTITPSAPRTLAPVARSASPAVSIMFITSPPNMSPGMTPRATRIPAEHRLPHFRVPYHELARFSGEPCTLRGLRSHAGALHAVAPGEQGMHRRRECAVRSSRMSSRQWLACPATA